MLSIEVASFTVHESSGERPGSCFRSQTSIDGTTTRGIIEIGIIEWPVFASLIISSVLRARLSVYTYVQGLGKNKENTSHTLDAFLYAVNYNAV